MARDTTLNIEVGEKTPGRYGKPKKRESIPLGFKYEGFDVLIATKQHATDKYQIGVANRIRRWSLALFVEFEKLQKKEKGKKT